MLTETVNNTEMDANTTMNTTNASLMNKSRSTSKLGNNFDATHNEFNSKDEDWFFRSMNRTTRDKILDTKEDFKKLRPQFYNTN